MNPCVSRTKQVHFRVRYESGIMNFDSDMQQSLTSFFHTKKNNTKTQTKITTTPPPPPHPQNFAAVDSDPHNLPHCNDCTLHASQIPLSTLPLSIVVVEICGSRSQLHSGQFCCRFGVRIRNGPTSGPRIAQNQGRLLL